jgi:hypothetical protein
MEAAFWTLFVAYKSEQTFDGALNAIKLETAIATIML